MRPASDMRVKALLSNMGEECPHLRKDNTGEDVLNHATGQYKRLGTILAAYYQPGSSAGKTGAGELDLPNTRFAVPTGIDIRQDDHIVYDKRTYEVESVVTRPSHLVVYATATQS